MLDYIHDQAKSLSSHWLAGGGLAQDFNELAQASVDLSATCIDADFLSKAISDGYFDYQTASVFSDFNFRPYSDKYMYAEVLNWSSMDTDLHNHDFVGLLWQINGIAMDVSYHFSDPVQLSEGVEFGELKVASVDILRGERRDMQRITTDDTYIHPVGHLKTPTTSLLFRTQPLKGFHQSIFVPPGLKLSFSLDVKDRKAIRFFNYLSSSGEGEIHRFISAYFIDTHASLARMLSVLIRLQPIYSKVDQKALLSALPVDTQIRTIFEMTMNAFNHYRIKREASWRVDQLSERSALMQSALSYGSEKNLNLIEKYCEPVY